jgi:hypothetical protein
MTIRISRDLLRVGLLAVLFTLTACGPSAAIREGDPAVPLPPETLLVMPTPHFSVANFERRRAIAGRATRTTKPSQNRPPALPSTTSVRGSLASGVAGTEPDQ